MKRYISNIIAGLTLVSAPALVSCSSDYLETAPTESVSTECLQSSEWYCSHHVNTAVCMEPGLRR